MSMLERRTFLGLSMGGYLALGGARLAFAAPASGTRRLVVVLQRGAADGLAIIAPVNDPGYSRLRGALAEDYSAAQKLDGLFALHPAMTRSAAFYGSGEMLAVQAVASAYRARSHFDGQNLLELGADRPYARKDGWLNRLVGILPGEAGGLAVSPVVPLAMQGPNRATSYAPSRLPEPSSNFLASIDTLYQADERLHALWQESVQTRAMVEGLDTGNGRNAAQIGALTAQLLQGDQGARIAMIETSGWDTHNGQRARLARELGSLDMLIGTLRDRLGPDWAETLVIVATEFGRTAAINGTMGTDHGTGSAAMLFGGTVRGGRVVCDWPGLGQNDLYEGRDLKPTQSLEAIIASAVSGHFQIDPKLVLTTLFPHIRQQAPRGLTA